MKPALRFWDGLGGDIALGMAVLIGAVVSFSTVYYLAPISATVFLALCLVVRVLGNLHSIRIGRSRRWRNAVVDLCFGLAALSGPMLGMRILHWRLRLRLDAYDTAVAAVAADHRDQLENERDTGVLPMPERAQDLGRSIRVLKAKDGHISAEISMKGDARYRLRLAPRDDESRVLDDCGRRLSDRWYLVVGPCGTFGSSEPVQPL